MKNTNFRTVALLSLIFISHNASGQIKKNDWLVGIAFSYATNKIESTQTNKEQKTTSSDIGLSAGRFLTKNFLVSMGYSYSNDYSNTIYTQDNYYKSDANSSDVTMSISLFSNLEKGFYYSPKFGLNYSQGKSKFWSKQPGFQEEVNTNSSKIISAAIYPVQFSYLLKNKILMQAGFGQIEYAYIHSKSDIPANNDAVGKSHGFNMSFLPNISNIGISIIF